MFTNAVEVLLRDSLKKKKKEKLKAPNQRKGEEKRILKAIRSRIFQVLRIC